jgi:hypothetical protein
MIAVTALAARTTTVGIAGVDAEAVARLASHSHSAP